MTIGRRSISPSKGTSTPLKCASPVYKDRHPSFIPSRKGEAGQRQPCGVLMRMRQPCRASTPSVGRRHGCRRAPALASATHGLRHSVLSATAAASVALDAVAPGWSVLISPDVQLPRDAATALRRSVPAVVAGSGNAQSALRTCSTSSESLRKSPGKTCRRRWTRPSLSSRLTK